MRGPVRRAPSVIVTGIVLGSIVAAPAAAAPDTSRGCPPGWGEMSIFPPGATDLEVFVWENVRNPEGFEGYIPKLDRNENDVVCVKWTWGDRLPEQSAKAETYHFVFRDDTSAAPAAPPTVPE